MKALFVPFAPSLAHVSRCLAVAEAWRAKGHMAIFAVGPEQADLVRGAGFETRPMPEVAGSVFRADRGFNWLTSEYFVQNLEVERAIMAESQPDVVVFDFRFTTAASARLAGLPSASIAHGNLLCLALRPRETAQLLIGDPGAVRGLAAWRLRVMRQLFPVGFQLIQRTAARRLASTLKANSLPSVNSPFELLLGDEVLIADIPALLPGALPRSGCVVGPLMWSGWTQPAPWLDDLDARPLIYVTMGSTVDAQSVLVKIIDALRGAPYNVVVTTGRLALPPDLDLPSHIHIFATVPGEAVMRRSTLAIHHGGHETLMQALAAGVPSLILPANPDQILVAQQVQALGIGHSLWRPGDLPMTAGAWSKWTCAELGREVDDLIADETCARNCRAFKQEIEKCHGAMAAVKALEEMVARPAKTV